MFTMLEIQMVSVERMHEYSLLQKEAAYTIPDKAPPASWPSRGLIVVNGLSLRYREGLPLVLDDISFTIQAREKIGVVGRTGAGKSTIVLALMRLVEPASGCIFIDGKDICKMGLFDLRSRLSVIPQDPVLFSGTLRHNLDPFSSYSDAAVWQSLDEVQLKGEFDDLDSLIEEGGVNLSVGERQLVGIARVILRRSQVIIMDEATASIDVTTDALIQEAMRTSFKESTTIVIAHRINT